jgi:uncharacterized membrane protein (DUF485 family)
METRESKTTEDTTSKIADNAAGAVTALLGFMFMIAFETLHLLGKSPSPQLSIGILVGILVMALATLVFTRLLVQEIEKRYPSHDPKNK